LPRSSPRRRLEGTQHRRRAGHTPWGPRPQMADL
jgi:hypothetical protein